MPEAGALSFVWRNKGWDQYLELKGDPLYQVGVACGTCQAIFQRVGDHGPFTPRQLSQRLEEGLTTIPDEIVHMMVPLLPKGEYVVGLIEVWPTRTTAAARPRGIGCEAEYFWYQMWDRRSDGCDYDLVVPFQAERQLSLERVADYRRQMALGQRPTALALSLGDSRVIRGEYYENAAAHFLLDGHHKMMAASQLAGPITVLSFYYEMTPLGQLYHDSVTRAHYEAKGDAL